MNVSIDSGIPYGNAANTLVRVKNNVAEVRFSPDPHGDPECLWFCFRINTGRFTEIQLVLENPGNMLGGNQPQNMRPVAKHDGGDWERLGQGEVVELPDGRHEVSWLITAPGRFVDVAYCYPYGIDEIDSLCRETGGYWRKDVIGVSQKGKPLIRLSNSYGRIGSERPGIYLMARQHSGETPGSWVMDGFLRKMAGFGDNAPIIWAIPLGNMDGVIDGDYGKDTFPYDLNRSWNDTPMRHEVLVYKRDIGRWMKRCLPILGIDFHAPGACETSGIYMFAPDPEKSSRQNAAALGWANIIAKRLTLQYAAEDFVRIANYPKRWDTPTFAAYFCDQLDVTGFTLENPYAMIGDLVLTRKDYREAGKRIAEAVIEYI